MRHGFKSKQSSLQRQNGESEVAPLCNEAAHQDEIFWAGDGLEERLEVYLQAFLLSALEGQKFQPNYQST
jgi:hypothetical protein